MEKLKPCPFCGGEAKYQLIYGGGYAVVCKECGVQMESGHYNDDDEVQKSKSAKAWNRRTKDG